MKTISAPLLPKLFCLLGLCLFWPSYGYAQDDNQVGVPVTVIKPLESIWPDEITAQGPIVPWEIASVSAKNQGLAIQTIAVELGSKVKKGQVLAELDRRLLQAEVAQAKSNVALTQAQWQLAQQNVKRYTSLKSQQYISEQEYQTLMTQEAIAKASVDQAQALLKLAEIRNQDATLYAPDDGIILAKTAMLGQVVQPGEELFKILRQEKMEWEAQVNADHLSKLKPDMAARIILASGDEVKGKVRLVFPDVDAQSRLGKLRVILEPHPALFAHTYSEGFIQINAASALAVPAECVVIKDGRAVVYKLDKGVAVQVSVTRGRTYRGQIELLSGIERDDAIVQEGSGFLNHGDKVTIIPSK